MSAIVFDATPPADRNRLTVFFRALMVIPHIVTLFIYGIGAFFAVVIAWFALLATGRYPEGLYGFVGNTVRYGARVNSYMYLLTDDYPPFDLSEHTEYPVRMHFGPAQAEYSRVLVLIRGILYIPVYIVSYVLQIVMYGVAILLWLLGVITGRSPGGLWDAQKFCLSYVARGYAYVCLLSDDFPAIQQDTAAAPAGLGGSPQGSYIPPVPVGSSVPAPPPPPPPPPAAPGGPSLEKNPFGE